MNTREMVEELLNQGKSRREIVKELQQFVSKTAIYNHLNKHENKLSESFESFEANIKSQATKRDKARKLYESAKIGDIIVIIRAEHVGTKHLTENKYAGKLIQKTRFCCILDMGGYKESFYWADVVDAERMVESENKAKQCV